MTGRRLDRRLRARIRNDAPVRELAEVARQADASLLLVGGYVRDAALGRHGHDLDLLCDRGTTRLIRALRARWSSAGFRFRKRGVTTWRFTRSGRQVDIVDATRRGRAGDLARRDLTINAIAFDLRTERVVDPHRGQRDLRAGRLRAPRRGSIRDDPVRAIRLARFTASLGARPHPDLVREASRAGRALRHASPERLRDELGRLLACPDPGPGLRLLDRTGLFPSILPEVRPMARCVAGADRPDVWTHTLDATALSSTRRRLPGGFALADESTRRVIRWALLLHDVSKPETLGRAADGRPAFHGHETLGARRADAILRRLRLPREERRRIVALVRLHLRPGHLADAGAPPRGIRRLVRDAGDDTPALVLHAACDARASGSPAAATRWRVLRLVLLSLLELWRSSDGPRPELPIDGRDVMRALGLEPGPEVGRVLDRAMDARQAGRLATRAEALAWLRRLARRRVSAAASAPR